MPDYPRIHIMNHPLITHKITCLRKDTTNLKDFRQLVLEIAYLIGYEATRHLTLRPEKIRTPLMEMEGKVLQQEVCLVPILRAGLGLVDSILELLPNAHVGHLGLYRDPKTLKPVEYFMKIPPHLDQMQVIILDPMLATGGSAIAAVETLKKHGAKYITMINLIGAPEGAEAFSKACPDVDVYLGCMDKQLNDHGYILPGLGDAGDRLFGTL